MYRLSYRDLHWDPVFLNPKHYTVVNGVQTQPGSSGIPDDMISIQPESNTAVIGMPAGRGKISDAGYDQMVCLAAGLSPCGHIIFRAGIRVLQYPSPEECSGQEGLGLFFRDTMENDTLTGYPYSNMAAAGIFHGKAGLFGRQGITPDSVENVQNFCSLDDSFSVHSFIGKKLDIVLEKQGSGLSAKISWDEKTATDCYTIVDEDAFASKDTDSITIGLFAARGCRFEADLDTVCIEYYDQADTKAAGSTLYASAGGSPSGRGSLDSPLSLQSAVDRCQCGQTVCVLPGRYRLSDDLVISRHNSGISRAPKKIRVENSSGEPAVLDFGGSEHGLLLEGNYWEISGLAVTRGRGFVIRGRRNRIERCLAVSNLETGFLIRHPSNGSPKEQWPAYNVIADCVSCLNKDLSEQNADGFACKIAAGPGNRFIRCTAWMNSDDGFDLFSKNRKIYPVVLLECRSWLNGFSVRDRKLVKTLGNGNGFKLGGSGQTADHEALQCEAIGNRGFGFTSNSNPHMRLISCRAENNRKNYMFYYTGPGSDAVYVTENCTEAEDPLFDHTVWAGENSLPGGADRTLLPEGDIINALYKDLAQKYNESVIRNGLKEAASLCAVKKADMPCVMIMCSSLYGGGAECVACRLASGLAERYNVYFLYIQEKGRQYYLDPRVKTMVMPFICGTWDTINTCRAEYVRKLKETLDIRVAVSFMYTMNRVNVESCGWSKVICSERNNPMKRYPERMEEINRLYEEADHVVFQTETVRSMFSGKVRQHSSIIMNPVEVTCEKTACGHRIVNVGRLVAQKNQAMLIRAFAAFYQDHQDYTLSFYGAGELFEELSSLAGSLGLEKAVRFHGHVDDVHPAIADAEIFALSSDYEGLSNALLECMMMGIPCISTRCEGSRDVIISGENGILVDVGSEEQMTAALTMLAENAGLRDRLGSMARKSAERFRKEPVLSQWEQLIEQLSAEGMNAKG